ncbi:hypothetical protein OA184_04055 [SAR86 cluster bacterium]|nr:hypothetical protein [SAR86 cluster bacterium]
MTKRDLVIHLSLGTPLLINTKEQLAYVLAFKFAIYFEKYCKQPSDILTPMKILLQNEIGSEESSLDSWDELNFLELAEKSGAKFSSF